MVGKTIGQYQILEELGRGGMGAVYKALDTKLDRVVALKFLSSNKFDSDLLREARAAAAINHPNICSIIDFKESDGSDFLVMEFIKGQSLRGEIEAGPMEIPKAVKTAMQVAEGLRAAHKKGIVHRDIKPENILITEDGVVKISDFGLARTLDSGGEGLSTGSGTIAYMSPEQMQNEPVDHHSDIWSLGVVLYEMVTGKRPFPGEYPEAVMYGVVNEKHPPVSKMREGVPASLERVIDHCLEKMPAVRFPDAGNLLDELRQIEHELKNPQRAESHSLAVLPFADISPDKDNQYFSDGLTEEIISRLSKLKSVRVVPRSSVIQYERSGKSTKQIAVDLGVNYILEGSVRKQGSAVRITTQLVDAMKEAYQWSEKYRGTMDDIFDIQESVASKIAKALKLHLTPGEKKTMKRRSTKDTEAYQLYLKGRFFWNKRSKDALTTAIGYFEEAIRKDSSYALAWTGLSDSYNLLAEYGGIDRKETYLKAKAAVQTALKLDAQLPEARTSLASLNMLYEWDWPNAEKEFKLSIYLNPNYATAHHWYGEWLMFMGRKDEAMRELNRAADLDPLSPAILKDKGVALYYLGQYDQAMDCGRKTLELDPTFAAGHRLLSLAHFGKGEFDKAIIENARWGEMTGNQEEMQVWLAHLYAVSGRRSEAAELIERLEKPQVTGGAMFRGFAVVYTALGDVDRAIGCLEKAYALQSESLSSINVDPKLEKLRSDPRFSAIVKRMGLKR